MPSGAGRTASLGPPHELSAEGMAPESATVSGVDVVVSLLSEVVDSKLIPSSSSVWLSSPAVAELLFNSSVTDFARDSARPAYAQRAPAKNCPAAHPTAFAVQWRLVG